MYANYEDDPNFVPMAMPLGMAGMAQSMANQGITPSMSRAIDYAGNGNAPMSGGVGYGAAASPLGGAAGMGTSMGAGQQGGVPALNGWDKFNNIMKGIGSIANIYMGYKNYKLAKDSLNFQKQSYATDLRNRVTDYNGQMTDMHQARGVMQGDSSGTVQDRIDRDRMTT